MLLVIQYVKGQLHIVTQRIADGIQTTVSRSSDKLRFSFIGDIHRYGYNISLTDKVIIIDIHVFLLEQIVDLIWQQLLVLMVGYILHIIANLLAHIGWQIIAVVFLEHVADAALTGLRVDADNICFIDTSDISWIDWQIRYRPVIRILGITVMHAFGNGILMRAGEGCEYQLTGIGLTHVYLHTGTALINLDNVRHIREVQLRIDSHRIHVHCKCNNIHISGTLPVAKQRSLDAVRTCQNTHFRISNATPAVIVRMQGYDNILTIVHMLAHVFNLLCINMRHTHFHSHRQIDDDLVVRSWLPYIQYGIADLQGIVHLCSGKAFR